MTASVTTAWLGSLIFGACGDALEIDTLLLSCRVLGRGVEHRMLNELGEIARRRQLTISRRNPNTHEEESAGA